MTENWPKVHTFRVAIRVRPFLKHETGNVPAIRFLPNDPQVIYIYLVDVFYDNTIVHNL